MAAWNAKATKATDKHIKNKYSTFTNTRERAFSPPSFLFPPITISILSRKSKARMVVSKVINIGPSKPIISLSSVSLSVLPQNASEENDTAHSADPQEAQTDTISRTVKWCFLDKKHVGGNDASNIAKTDCHGGGDGAFVVSRHAVLYPCQDDWLGDIATRDHEEERKVFDAYR